MRVRTSLVLVLLLCTAQSGVLGISLFNFWSHILPGSKPEENSVIASSVEDTKEYGNDTIITTSPTTQMPMRAKEVDLSSEESSKITELLNPMTWFKKTRKENSFEINAELGTVRVAIHMCAIEYDNGIIDFINIFYSCR